MKMVLASKNPHKLTEMTAILSQLGVEVVLESDVGVDVDVEETGETFEENSLLKAKAVMEASGLPAIADDSGLCVAALGGGPGIYSARYGGEGLDDKGRYELVLQGLSGQIDRSAKFVSVITACFPNGDVLSARGECPGLIAYAPMGEDGFGYDPVFLVPEKKKTFAQMTAQEKNELKKLVLGEVIKQGMTEYWELVVYAMYNMDNAAFDLISTNTVFFNAALKSKRHMEMAALDNLTRNGGQARPDHAGRKQQVAQKEGRDE